MHPEMRERPPAEGERRAAGGYHPQWLAAARITLTALASGELEWVRIADPEAGRVDDFAIGTSTRVHGYQVKWARYGGAFSFSDLAHGQRGAPPLILQLADGWRRLRVRHPTARVVVHLVTNQYPSSNDRLPETEGHSGPAHFAAFLAEVWASTLRQDLSRYPDRWHGTSEALRVASALGDEDYSTFLGDCELELRTPAPTEDPEVKALAELFFSIAAGSGREIELNRRDLLARLGWQQRYSLLARHEFPDPEFLYQPIVPTAEQLENALAQLPGGFVGVFGPPGSGKSTLLTKVLRGLGVRFVPYYVFVPRDREPSVLRGESSNLLHDVTLRLQGAGFEQRPRPDPRNREALLLLFHAQLAALGRDFTEIGRKTVLLIDGLDHIGREQSPERSLLADLPMPDQVPAGVYLVLGSQTDQFPDLPARIRHEIQHGERRIEMGRLSHADVVAVTRAAIPGFPIEHADRAFHLSEGHPLALMYLVRRLQRCGSELQLAQALADTFPFQQDIEAYYASHWQNLERDPALTHTLGLLARVRGSISMRWVASWLEENSLSELSKLRIPYFDVEQPGEKWSFFHNSFRLFLLNMTGRPLPGRSREEQERAFHRRLAELFEAAEDDVLRREAQHHRFEAGDLREVVSHVSWDWLEAQTHGLRSGKRAKADLRLAIRAAGLLRDSLALVRLVLIGASLDRRYGVLEARHLPELLIRAGEIELALEHVRDGQELLLDGRRVLGIAALLAECGYRHEARRLFELAAPYDLLAGELAAHQDRTTSEPFEVMAEWARAAPLFHTPQDVLASVGRITFGEEPEATRLWMVYHAASACARRRDWSAWEVLDQALPAEAGSVREHVILRGAEEALRQQDDARAEVLVQRLDSKSEPPPIGNLEDQLEDFRLRLRMADLLSKLAKPERARYWLQDMPPVPLEFSRLQGHDGGDIEELRFTQCRLAYLLGDRRERREVLDTAEAATDFRRRLTEEERAEYRRMAAATVDLARLWADGRRGARLEPPTFSFTTEWIIEQLGPIRRGSSASLFLARGSASKTLARLLVWAAREHGERVVAQLTATMSDRWSDPANRWPDELRRDLVLDLVEAGAEKSWARDELARIGQLAADAGDPYARAEFCEHQAAAWLRLECKKEASEELTRMVLLAQGVLGDEDHQLEKWVSWLRQANIADPGRSEERIRLMLRRLIAARDQVAGIEGASLELLTAAFNWSPRRSIRLLQGLQELEMVHHQGAVTSFLRSCLGHAACWVGDLVPLLVELLLPFARQPDAELVEKIIDEMGHGKGRRAALVTAGALTDAIARSALKPGRAGWLKGIAAGLKAIGEDPARLGVQPCPELSIADSVDDSRGLHLKDGRTLGAVDARRAATSIENLRELMSAADPEKSEFFDWEALVVELADRLTTPGDVREAVELVEARIRRRGWTSAFTALSRRALNLGARTLAGELAARALDAAEPYGWDTWFEGERLYNAAQAMIDADPQAGRERLLDKFAKDMAESAMIARAALHLGRILPLLPADLTVTDVWPEIERYLADLFQPFALGDAQVLEEQLLARGPDWAADDLQEACADLLALYLDHPSHVVAHHAARAMLATFRGPSTPGALAIARAITLTEQSRERALVVLAAALTRDRTLVPSFEADLGELAVANNLVTRVQATTLLRRIGNEGLGIKKISDRDISAMYRLDLGALVQHDTLREDLGHPEAPVVGDPARVLRPLDIEARVLEELSSVKAANLIVRANQFLPERLADRLWLTAHEEVSPQQLSHFLEAVGLRVTHFKPHIAAARQALAHVAGELWDGGYLSERAMQKTVRLFWFHDPAFLAWVPTTRPTWIEPVQGLPENYAGVENHKQWLGSSQEALALAPLRANGWVILAESTLLRRLRRTTVDEHRMAVLMPKTQLKELDENAVEEGHVPFESEKGLLVEEYLTHPWKAGGIAVYNAGYEFEEPGASWLALNPVIGRGMCWTPCSTGWFAWLDNRGEVVAESLWWMDGSTDRYDNEGDCEVARGWLVRVKETAFSQIRANVGEELVRVLAARRSIESPSGPAGAAVRLVHLGGGESSET